MPPVHSRKFVRDSVGFAFSQYLVRMLNLTRGLVAARLLGPGPYGVWSALLLLFEGWRRARRSEALTRAQFARRMAGGLILEVDLVLWLLADLVTRHWRPAA